MARQGRLALKLKALSRSADRHLARFTPRLRTSVLDERAVRSAYARWAPVYDLVFRAPLYWGRRAAVDTINPLAGKVLEAGVGTGMSLSRYRPHLSVTGIDLSREMLDKARKRATHMPHVDAILEMDAGNLDFPNSHFDVTVAMYLLPVVPDPRKVMAELARVTRPGGQVILVNHFSAERGIRATLERLLARASDTIGWDPLFPREQVMDIAGLTLMDSRALPPARLFTLLRFVKEG
ncbi:class I SAM-dependent methyltransferase [Roseibium aestuarii]|uniref:Class I SAM-dependent methyltransferase n=1 Tax=Roseibium aestuarii TaxID=2600299 RepID=A0ABW4JVX1_9HYPH|nr:class I SAM-dependent methyltransferase [Roseibium aestuarii]